MTKITAFEAKTRFGELLDRVSKGEEIVITKHERPVARMIPEGPNRSERVREAVDSLIRLQKEIAARTRNEKPLSYAQVRSAIEEGRR